MASGNRVEELESRVRQLEASVTGLTDELVECKERIQALEAEVDPDADALVGRTGGADPTASESEGDKSERNQEEEQSGSSGSDEIIVA